VIDLNKYYRDDEEVLGVAQAERIGAGRGILHAVEIVREDLQRRLKTQPRMSPGDFKKDVRYLLGGVAVCDFILSLPAETREGISKTNRPAGQQAEADTIIKSRRGV